MKRKPIKGETLYLRNVNRHSHADCDPPKPVIVDSVGRKYFTIGRLKFNIETWRETTLPGYYYLYETLEEWQQRVEFDKLWGELTGIMRNYIPSTSFTLDQLRRVHAILTESR